MINEIMLRLWEKHEFGDKEDEDDEDDDEENAATQST